MEELYYDSTLTGPELDAALAKLPQMDAALGGAQAAQQSAAQSAEAAAASAATAAESEEQSAQSAGAADASQKQAAASEAAATASAQAAKASEGAAGAAKEAAAASEKNAGTSAARAAESAAAAQQSAQEAGESEQAAEDWAGLAQSYAVGTGAPDQHPGEETDNAKYYAEQAAGSAADAAGSVEVIKTNADAIQAVKTNLAAILAAAENALAAQSAAEDAATSAEAAQEAADRAQSISQGALGYYATAAKLSEDHESGSNGQWAIIGETDTIWVWDSDSGSWVNSGQKTDLSNYYTKDQTDAEINKLQTAMTQALTAALTELSGQVDEKLAEQSRTLTEAISTAQSAAEGAQQAADAADEKAVTAQAAADAALPKSGGTMTGDITMAGHKVTGLPTPTADTDATTLEYIKSLFAWKTLKSGSMSDSGAYLAISYNAFTGMVLFTGGGINTPTFTRVDHNPLIVPDLTLPEILRPTSDFYIQNVGPLRGTENNTSIVLKTDGSVRVGGAIDVSSTGFSAQKLFNFHSEDYLPYFPNFHV